MAAEDLTLDLLAFRPFWRLAAALRTRVEAIIGAWEEAVRENLPAADELTLQQLRNSLPLVLEEIAHAFASSTPKATRELIEGSKSHGTTRFHENYSIRELVVEYRLLRRIVIEQLAEELGEDLDTETMVALNMALDAVLQSGVVTFTNHLQQQILAAAEIQSKYLSFLSHDLRNHLSQAVMQIQLLSAKLAKAPEYAETVAGIESVKRAILRTTAGMDRLLEAEQLRHGSANLDIHPVDLSQLLLEVSEQWQYEAQLKGLELRVEVPDGAKVSSDERLLTLVLQNLLGNAVKYSSTGTINISAGKTFDGGVAVWIFSISDQGPGIPLEGLTRLFDAFKRGDTYGKPGVGLGLSIATHAAKLLGGELRVESQVGVGSTFQLVLPNRNSSPVWAVPDTA